jgi:bifunctional UDP-N-acetylglucosamine pyrophosphorylase/glucosamine-1-phosphate N-acetyltransferase
VTVGAGAITAAGSVIVRDVSPDALAIARGIQVEKPDRAAEFRSRAAARNTARMPDKLPEDKD